jgi:hypothetical protein
VQSSATGTLTVETNQVITRLAADCAAIQPLGVPWRRTMLWLMISLLCVATVTATQLAGRDALEDIDFRMAVEQGAILLAAK